MKRNKFIKDLTFGNDLKNQIVKRILSLSIQRL